MRLLYTASDGRLRWTKEYIGNEKIPAYAILSHTWGEQEVIFDDLKNLNTSGDIGAKSKAGWDKIRFCAQQTMRDGLDHFWVDACCIDKSNSQERQDDRFSWAEKRQTTREEDRAYCLLGIFGVNLPLIYSEGEENAFYRLRDAVATKENRGRSRGQEERLGNMCSWLSAPDPATNYHKAHKQRQAETGLWLLQNPRFAEWKESAASRLWLTATVMQQFTHAYIVLDALDECTQRLELMDVLETLTGWQLDNVHLLMTSRKERDIESSLESYVKEEDTICLQRDVVDKDIQRYVQQRLSNDKSLTKWNKDATMRQEIEAAPMHGARGMFQWAVCQLDTLKKCRNRAMLRESLATLPQTLDQTYDRILTAISKEDCKYAMRILQWLTFSARPLLIEEIAEVVAIDVARDPAFDRDEVLEDPLDALNICSSLVIISTVKVERQPKSAQRIIALAHYSVQEYLVSDRIKQGQAKQFSMQEVECHNAITKSSLMYLIQFQQPLSTVVLEASALARYAAEFWSRHLRNTGNETEGSLPAMTLMSADNPAYINWIKLYDPDQPWTDVDLGRGVDLGIGLERIPMPLYCAALLGLSTVTRLLLDKGADVNAQGGSYGNALQAASARGHQRVVEMLLDAGAHQPKEDDTVAGLKCLEE